MNLRQEHYEKIIELLVHEIDRLEFIIHENEVFQKHEKFKDDKNETL